MKAAASAQSAAASRPIPPAQCPACRACSPAATASSARPRSCAPSTAARSLRATSITISASIRRSPRVWIFPRRRPSASPRGAASTCASAPPATARRTSISWRRALRMRRPRRNARAACAATITATAHSAEEEGQMVNLRINDRPVTVEDGTSILHAARQLGIPIPSLCYLKHVSKVAACRVCMVEIGGYRPPYGGVRHDLRRGHGGLYEHAARARSAAQQRAAHSLDSTTATALPASAAATARCRSSPRI